ncbi:GtrA family protein [Helcococcus massiliensis]|uniref:GtrA family protein n=1 Tax=Helcococcus massiliensis TaxID=2040290 RepID=UPI000CDE5BFE|nr:GtrA family protein [Helcococcus massiliensis]
MKNNTPIHKRYGEAVNYIIFGALTTLVNFVVYFFSYNVLSISNVFSNIIAWAISATFAFVVNKFFVFNSKLVNFTSTVKEFITFISVRLSTGVIDTLIMYIGVDVLNKNEFICKVIASIFTLVSNYIASKFFIFKKNKEV